MNYIDMMITNSLKWINEIINFVKEFKLIFVIGFLAMMVSKVIKVNIKN